MARALDETTLGAAAQFYATEILRPTRWSPNSAITPGWAGEGRFSRVARGGRDWVIQSLYNATFKDEFGFLCERMKEWMGAASLNLFDAVIRDEFAPRDDKVFADLLKERLACDHNGNHIEGAVGKVEIDRRPIRRRAVMKRSPILRRVDPDNPMSDWQIVDYRERVVSRLETWPIYAGETEERLAGRIRKKLGEGPGADPLPEDAMGMPVGANVTNISAEACIGAIDYVVDRLDEGSTAATIRGRTGTQPADPDASESGSLLFTLTCSDPASAAAVDDTDGSCSATFSSITDDSSADATGTLSYCRFGATGTGADDHIDGNATTDGSGATDWNTLSITSGSTVSMTSAVAGMSQGSTAS